MKNQTVYDIQSDQELLEQFRLFRNKQCLGILLQRYTLLLLGVCLKYLKNEEEAKDAVQQVFTKAIIELEKYPVEHFKSWLYTIARNHCFMNLRNKAHPLPEEAIDKNIHQWHEEPGNFSIQRVKEKEQLLEWLEDALPQLQPNQRECISLFYLEKKSYRQISEQTGLNLLQIKSYIQNGKRNLKLMIEKKQQKNAS